MKSLRHGTGRLRQIALAACLFVVAAGVASIPDARAVPVYYLGQVLEDTPEMNPVEGAIVTVTFVHSSGAEFVVESPQRTDANGFYIVSGDPSDSLSLVLFDSAQIHVGATDDTEPGSDSGDVAPELNVSGLLGAAGITTDLQSIALNLIANALGINDPTSLLSTQLTQQGGFKVTKVAVSTPEPSTLALLSLSLIVLAATRYRLVSGNSTGRKGHRPAAFVPAT